MNSDDETLGPLPCIGAEDDVAEVRYLIQSALHALELPATFTNIWRAQSPSRWFEVEFDENCLFVRSRFGDPAGPRGPEIMLQCPNDRPVDVRNGTEMLLSWLASAEIATPPDSDASRNLVGAMAQCGDIALAACAFAGIEVASVVVRIDELKRCCTLTAVNSSNAFIESGMMAGPAFRHWLSKGPSGHRTIVRQGNAILTLGGIIRRNLAELDPITIMRLIRAVPAQLVIELKQHGVPNNSKAN
ncbi:MAG: hypothetical protein EON59_02555 [Alphaproteobacteria bacterium]|nr:MAG: hypothetical protein EON59_02555 [Alphaproteobacteria bacterium]